MSTPSANTAVFKTRLFLTIVGLVGIVALARPFSARVRGAASTAAPSVTSITQVTHYGFRKTNLLADDSELFVTELPAANRVIAKVSLPDSRRSLVASPFSNLQALDLSPDRSRLLVAPIQAGSSDDEFWTLPVGSGSPQRIGDLAGRDASWSADGQHLVFSQGAVLYVAGAAGTEKHELYTAPGPIFAPHFSPDGQRIRFTVSDAAQNTTSIWEIGQAASTRTLCWGTGSTRRPHAAATGRPTAATTFFRHRSRCRTRAQTGARCGHYATPHRARMTTGWGSFA